MNWGDIDTDVVGVEGENDVRRCERVEANSEAVDVEARGLSLLILPSATASFTAALLGEDGMVDIDRAGGRVVADCEDIDFVMGGNENRDLDDASQRVAPTKDGIVSFFLVSFAVVVSI